MSSFLFGRGRGEVESFFFFLGNFFLGKIGINIIVFDVDYDAMTDSVAARVGKFNDLTLVINLVNIM